MNGRRTLRPDSPTQQVDRIAEMAGRQGSPYTGKLSARPAGKPGDFFLVEGEFATIPSTPPDSATVCILDIQFDIGRELAGVTVRAQEIGTRYLYRTHRRENRFGA